MIVADTSIWIDHFHKGEPQLAQLLLDGDVVTHPLIVLELALGSIANRNEVISNLKQLPRVKIADQEELFQLVEARSLYGVASASPTFISWLRHSSRSLF